MAGQQKTAGGRLKKRSLLEVLSRPWLILLFMVLIYLGANITRSYYKNKALKARWLETQEEVARQQTINQEIREKMVRLEDEQELARLAREKLGLVKEGEVVYKIVKKEK